MDREPPDHSPRRDVLGRIAQVVRSLDFVLSEVQGVWANGLDLTVPQWNILVTVAEAQQRDGLTITAVARSLRVHPSFIGHQLKPLEGRGFIQRRSSTADKRNVYLSITPRALKELSHLAKSRDVVGAAIEREIGQSETLHTIELLQQMERCLARCRLRLQIED